jgi:hypothetical protein
MFSAEVDKRAIISHWIQKLTKMLQAGLSFRQDNPGRIIDISFGDFLHSELNVMESIIDQISFIPSNALDFKDTAKSRYVSKHQYNLEDWGIDRNQLHEKFDFYHQKIFRNSSIKYSNG